MSFQQFTRWGIYPLWLLLAASILFRTPTPIDETRYLSVAWEMWLRQEFLVPYLNGAPYSHKPPLLFWLIHASWSLFGVSGWAAAIVGPLLALLNLVLVRRLAAALWPDSPGVAMLAPWILIGTLLWTLFATATMFDILLSSCVLLGMHGLIKVVRGKVLTGWSMLAVAVGLGVLAKGPVILVHLLPLALLMPLWVPEDRQTGKLSWYACLLLSVLSGALLALAWAIPAAIYGGEVYSNAILWSQTADRVATSRHHARPFWWFLVLLPLVIFPWFTWPRVWQYFAALRWKEDSGVRFCLIWFGGSFVIFSIIPSKQIHYLLPLLPALSLLVARFVSLDEKRHALLAELVPSCFLFLAGAFLMTLPALGLLDKLAWVRAMDMTWGGSVLLISLVLLGVTCYMRQLLIPAASTAIVLSVFIGFICFFRFTGLAYNLEPAAERVRALQDQGIPVAYEGDYHGEFHFLGRLTLPIEKIPLGGGKGWAVEHPQGYVITKEEQQDKRAFYSQRQRERWLNVRSAQQLLTQ